MYFYLIFKNRLNLERKNKNTQKYLQKAQNKAQIGRFRSSLEAWREMW